MTIGEPQVMRISPSGAIAGDESYPPLVGGTADPPDGSVQLGREWLYNGLGTNYQQLTSTGDDVDGMDVVTVDLRPGYAYDVELDVDAYGTFSTVALSYAVSVDSSDDGGSTWSTGALLAHTVYCSNDMFTGRGHQLQNWSGTAANAARVHITRNGTAAPAGDMYINPEKTVLRIREFKRP